MKAYITKIDYVLPHKVEKNPVGRLAKKTGIESRHICEQNETALDLAYSVSNKLLCGVDRQSIDMLILCTQSPDYCLPTSACILQNKLGLAKNCGAFDYNLGCSGYIYGLSIAKGFIESKQAQKILLVTAETYSKYINEMDNTVKPLFGDAATATMIEAMDTDVPGLDGFVLGTDGSGYKNLIVPVSGMRERFFNTPLKESTDTYGNYRTNRNLFMNGSAISEFALDVVPQTVNKVLGKVHLEKEDIDYYVFHQANKFMLKYLQEKCDLVGYPYWNDVKNYGNTVSCSIPIALCDMTKKYPNVKIILSIGFGVGLSWGGCVIRLNNFGMLNY